MSENSMLPSEGWAVVGTIDPDAYTAATYLSDAIDMANYHQIMVVGMVGTMASSSTVDLKVTQATTSGGTYKDVTGAAVTQLTQASPDDSDKQVIINVKGTDLDMDSDYRYVKASLTVATAASDAAVVVLGQAKTKPASDNDLASVAEIVS